MSLLREVAQRLKSAVRAVDTTARLGGDEFVILLGGPVTQAEAVEIGTRAIQLMEPSMRLLGIDVHISPSIGIAFYPRDGASVDTLLARADAAMYSAKERGRNNVQCYAEGMSTVTQERVKLESDLHEALRNGQFELHYQPKVDTVDRSDQQRRGPDPLAASAARPRAAERLHCDRRRVRPARCHRRVGAV